MLSIFLSWGGLLAIFSVCWGAGAALAHAADVVQSTGSFSAGVSPSSKNASNTLRVYCDGDRYGRNLNVGSCRSVFDHWGTDEAQTRFAQRHSGVPYDLPLPYRLYSDDGLCFVQPILKGDATSGYASNHELGQAAFALLNACVMERGVGGDVGNIGGDNNIVLAMSRYQPNVRCDRSSKPGPPWSSCFHIVSDMQASQERQVFGHVDTDPRVQVNLPFTYRAIDARCMVVIDIKGKASTVSSYEIWEETLAVVSMCVRGLGKGGKAISIGPRRNIFLEVLDQSPDMDKPSGNITLVSNVSGLTANGSGLGGQIESSTAVEDPTPSPSGIDSNLKQNDSSLVTFPDDNLTRPDWVRRTRLFIEKGEKGRLS